MKYRRRLIQREKVRYMYMYMHMYMHVQYLVFVHCVHECSVHFENMYMYKVEII